MQIKVIWPLNLAGGRTWTKVTLKTDPQTRERFCTTAFKQELSEATTTADFKLILRHLQSVPSCFSLLVRKKSRGEKKKQVKENSESARELSDDTNYSGVLSGTALSASLTGAAGPAAVRFHRDEVNPVYFLHSALISSRLPECCLSHAGAHH